MNNISKLKTREYFPFAAMLAVNIGFILIAFIVDTPANIMEGFIAIIMSRSILITDYVAIGGVGAAMLNIGIVGLAGTSMMLRIGVKPTGLNIMGLWLSIGFAFFGKNVFNMIPLTFGVWLFAKYCRKPFSDYYLAALLVATLSPTISEIAFMGRLSPLVEIPLGIAMGFGVGFIFPVISAESVKTHNGFNLYNMGFSGGLIATVLSTLFRNFGVEVERGTGLSYGHNAFFAILMYGIAVYMLLLGFLSDWGVKDLLKTEMKNIRGFFKIHSHSGKLTTDFYHMYGNSIYINMAVLCALGTTVVLIMGGDLNGPNLAGILTMAGFGSLGKHFKNVMPIMIGAIISSYANNWVNSGEISLILTDPNTYLIMILFSSGLAPFAGEHGLGWGIVAGFLHVNVASYIGDLNMGLNLYNNGFAASFVVMFLLPIVMLSKNKTQFRR